MKISTRLSITFSIIASTIFIAFGFTVYYFSSSYRHGDFQERLSERIIITEKMFLEKESFSPIEFEKITKQFLHKLPEETEEVVLIQKGKEPIFKHNYPQEYRDKMMIDRTFDFDISDLQGTSKKFRVEGKDYLIIVTAVDRVGLQNISFLKNILLLLVLLGVPLIFIGSFIITIRELLPISKKIDKVNTITISNLHRRLNVHNPSDELGKMATAFNKLLDRLESSFESQKAFIRNASHEIRNPLTAIMGEAEVAMSKSRTTDEYMRSLGTILSEAETLDSTVTNLLQLSKVTASEENIKFETFLFDKFLLEIKEGYDFLNPLNKLSVHVSDENYSISGNKNLLKTAIINLFDNASKFSFNRKVEVVLARNNNLVQLTIKDVGIGILPNDIEKVITPFYRGNNALKEKGSGIGLSLSSKIIKIHKGVLEIRSQIKIGTEIHVKIPIVVT
jgi:signal transduction histidine kinase